MVLVIHSMDTFDRRRQGLNNSFQRDSFFILNLVLNSGHEVAYTLK